jgi:hypothetical protein
VPFGGGVGRVFRVGSPRRRHPRVFDITSILGPRAVVPR